MDPMQWALSPMDRCYTFILPIKRIAQAVVELGYKLPFGRKFVEKAHDKICKIAANEKSMLNWQLNLVICNWMDMFQQNVRPSRATTVYGEVFSEDKDGIPQKRGRITGGPNGFTVGFRLNIFSPEKAPGKVVDGLKKSGFVLKALSSVGSFAWSNIFEGIEIQFGIYKDQGDWSLYLGLPQLSTWKPILDASGWQNFQPYIITTFSANRTNVFGYHIDKGMFGGSSLLEAMSGVTPNDQAGFCDYDHVEENGGDPDHEYDMPE